MRTESNEDSYLALPDGAGPHPGVVVIHEASGLNDNIRDVCRRFAEHGYAALGVDLFGGRNRVVCMARMFVGGMAGNLDYFGVPALTVESPEPPHWPRRPIHMPPAPRSATWTAMILVASFLLTACAGAGREDSGGDLGTGTVGESPAGDPYPDLEGPPPVTVRFGDEAIELAAYAYCFGSVCADGIPPEPLPDIGEPAEVVVEFPLSGWSFTAYFTPSGENCGRQQVVPLMSTGGGAFALHPAGRADTYDVTLSGQGDGDLVAAFRWTTPTAGPLPEPEARLAVLADHDGRVDSYGVELELSNLARTPADASATITVRAETGEAVTFEGTPSKNGCLPEGTVYWDGPDAKGLEAAALGGDTFTYEVDLVLDGERYVGTGRWPADEIFGNEPSVALRFTPDLPSPS